MARPLPFALDVTQTRPKRRPGYRVFLYDLLSGGNTIGDVVRELPLNALTGPLEVTGIVESVQVDEVAGDFVSSGIPSSSITLRLIDETPGAYPSRLDPQFSLTDPTAPARFLRARNAIRIVEGDLDADVLEWPLTFTGILVGQAGVDRSRAVDELGRSLVTMGAVSRDAQFINTTSTSDEFAAGVSFLTMATEIATADMGLDSDEIDFAGWGGQISGISQQFVDQSPLVSIAQLMFLDGLLPRFDGEGKLTQTAGDIGQAPSRVYSDLEILRGIAKPWTQIEPINQVTVCGLEDVKTKVVQPRQPLRTPVEVTTGYFTSNEEIRVFWSDDRTILAQNVGLEIQKSVNGGLSFLGGGETFSLLFAQGEIAPDGLTVGAQLELETGFAPYVIVFLTTSYVALAAIPDEVTTLVFGGVTIPTGRIAQAAALASVLILMTKIGRGQYVFAGEPVEYVFRKLTGIAESPPGLSTEELNPVTVENHLIASQADVEATAQVVLFRQQARGNPRTITTSHDLRLEPDDVFEIPGPRRFLIEKISRTLRRQAAEVEATLTAFEVTAELLAQV